jgi:uncharacterized protein YqeY
MRASDEVRKSTLRQLLTAVRNAAIPPEREDGPVSDASPQRTELNDDTVLDIIRRQIKQRRDSIDLYRKANRTDLAAKEEAEAAILAAYLPMQMGKDQIVEVAQAIIERVGAKGPADKGKVMPVIMGELRGRAEGRDINDVVSELLSKAAG